MDSSPLRAVTVRVVGGAIWIATVPQSTVDGWCSTKLVMHTENDVQHIIPFSNIEFMEVTAA